jgi:hypothetical protein
VSPHPEGEDRKQRPEIAASRGREPMGAGRVEWVAGWARKPLAHPATRPWPRRNARVSSYGLVRIKRPLGSFSRVAFDANCRTHPVPFVEILTNTWHLGSRIVLAPGRDSDYIVSAHWSRLKPRARGAFLRAQVSPCQDAKSRARVQRSHLGLTGGIKHACALPRRVSAEAHRFATIPDEQKRGR